MSRYAIPTIAQADIESAASAEIGAETRIFYSQGVEYFIACLQQDVAADGTLTKQNTYSPPTDLTKGFDIQAILKNALVSPGGAFSAQLNVTFAGVAITSASVASPSVITTAAPHNLTDGQTVNISGVTGATPSVNGVHVITKTGTNTFTIPVDVTVAGTGGFVNAEGTATANFAVPGYVPDQSYNLPQGLAIELLPDDVAEAALQIQSIDSLGTVTNGGPGTIVEFYALPSADTWIELGCTDDKNFQPPSPEPVSIPCGYESSRWIKAGRNVKQTLDLTTKYRGFVNGVGRVNGQRFSLKAETRKDKRILAERMVFLGVRGSIDIKKPDGNGLAMGNIKAEYETMGVFC